MTGESKARRPPKKRAKRAKRSGKNTADKRFVSHGNYKRWGESEEPTPTQHGLRTPVSSPELQQLTRVSTLRSTRLFCESQRIGLQPLYTRTLVEYVGPRAHACMWAPAETWEPDRPPEGDYDPAIFRNGFCDEFLCTNPASVYGFTGYESLYFEDEPAEMRIWTELNSIE